MRKPFASFVEAELQPKSLVITCGLPASYKTGIAQEISKMKGYPILRSDLIRLEVLKGKDVFDVKVAGNMNNRLSVYDEMFRRAESLATKGVDGLILDATFVTQDLRERAAEIAAKNNFSLAIFETSCPQEVALDRIKKRTKEKYESNALTEEAYLANKNKFEPVNVDELKHKFPALKMMHLIVDTCVCGMANWTILKEDRR
ncbi:MAG: AAA family ATPase [Candidatus Bathyarchaeia archaeon]|jgi:predicted kinase